MSFVRGMILKPNTGRFYIIVGRSSYSYDVVSDGLIRSWMHSTPVSGISYRVVDHNGEELCG